MDLSLKKCTLVDLDPLIEISRSTFITSFEKDNNPDDFKTYITSAFSKEKIRSELLNPHSTFYFVYLDDNLVGYFKLNEKDAQNEQFEDASIELERIYVKEAFQGRQIGKEMLFKVIEIVKSKDVTFLWLGVWEHNDAAIRFYERYNFKKFSTHPYYLGSDKQTDWLLKIELH
jgi:ribosomal protein S18 acetylase RimI-like enzyme